MPESTRRRSPGWVRALDQQTLHRMAFRFSRDRETVDLTPAQEWLWDGLVSELEYRHRHPCAEEAWCACQLCIPPF